MNKGYMLAKRDWIKANNDYNLLKSGNRNLIRDSHMPPVQTSVPSSFVGERIFIGTHYGKNNVWKVTKPAGYFSTTIPTNNKPYVERGKLYTYSIDVMVVGDGPKPSIYLSATSGGYIPINENIQQNKWTRVSVTTPSVTRDGIIERPHFNFQGYDEVYISFFPKLEEGTHKTEYTPAPEDLFANNLITSLAENTFELSDNLWRKTIEDYSIVGVGGRNLLLGTIVNQSTGLFSWANSKSSILRDEITFNDGTIRTGGGISKWATTELVPDKDYVLSFEAYTKDKNFKLNYIHLMQNDGTSNRKLPDYFKLTDKFEKHEIPFRLVSSLSVWRLMIAGEGNHICFRNVKIEEGSTSSDWTPAPEDIEASEFVTLLAEDNWKQQKEISELRNAILQLGGK